MTNLEAAEVLRSRLKQDNRMQFLAVAVRQAYEKAIVALEHQPDTLHNEKPESIQCESCGTGMGILYSTCPNCGSVDLRPVYATKVRP